MFTFFYGAACGSSRKTLRQLEESNVMLNYATQNNTPWDGIERLFIDSGGYSFMKGMGEYGTSNAEYLEFVAEHQPELFALRDYPCELDVLDEHNRTVMDHQQKTLNRHRELLDLLDDEYAHIDSEPVSVLQGWALEDYLTHLDVMCDAGCLTEYVGIGSVCRPNAADEIRTIVTTVRDELPSRCKFHGFGLKTSVLQFTAVVEALDSADSMAYQYQTQIESAKRYGGAGRTWTDTAYYYLKFKRGIEDVVKQAGRDDEQAGLGQWTTAPDRVQRPETLPDTEEFARGPPPCQSPDCMTRVEPGQPFCAEHP